VRQVVFILSCDSSGSTWLGYVLGSHSRCAFVGELYRAWKPELREPCAWCAGQGRTECEALHGIELAPPESAYDFVLDRLNADTIIDTTKKIDWVSKYANSRRGYDVKFLHLMRDPRGWYESRKRRSAQPLDIQLAEWCGYNSQIWKFIRSTGMPSATLFYDETAAHPTAELPKLCAFLGSSFEPDALAYWQKPHHAFAANGASNSVLRGLPRAEEMQFFVTGDDRYYEEHRKQSFVDERWKERLSDEEKQAIAANPEIRGLMAAYGRTLSEAGIEKLNGSDTGSATDFRDLFLDAEQRVAAARDSLAIAEQRAASLAVELRNTKQATASLHEQLGVKDQMLNSVLNSRGWRLLNRYRALKQHLSPKQT
jgi:hypothetical protein